MRLDINGRLLLEIERTPGGYLNQALAPEGNRRRRDDLVLPPNLPKGEIAQCLDGRLHELAGPGQSIRRVDKP
jgi:hypothetical protein